MKKHKFGSKNRKSAHAVLFGTACSAIVFLLFTLLASAILLLTKDPLSGSGAAGLAVLVASGIVSSFLTTKYKGEAALAPTLISAALTSALFTIISLLTNSSSGIMAGLMNGISYFLPAALIAFIATKKKKRAYGKFR